MWFLFLQKPLKNFERVELGNQQQSLDYSQYEFDDDQNLIFYGQNGVPQNQLQQTPDKPLGKILLLSKPLWISVNFEQLRP